MKNHWRGKHIWLIGASTGIGKALAEEFAAQGAHVAISARNAEALQCVCAALPGDGHQALPLDVTDAQALQRASEHLRGQWPKLDAVIYAAGVYTPMRATEMDLAKAQQMIDINLKGALNMLAAILPSLIAQRDGRIVLIASVAGYNGLPNGLAYGASKAGLINLAETLYNDLKDVGIRVSLVNPGFVRTPLTAPNTFPMPFIIEPEDAATRIIAGLEAGRFEIHFPVPLSVPLKWLRLFPYALSLRLIKRITGL